MVAPAYSRSAAGEAVFWRSCAELLEAGKLRLVAENARLAGTVAARQEQLAALKQRVVTLSRMLFGASSDRSDKPGAGGRAAAGSGDDSRMRVAGPGGRRGQRPGRRGVGGAGMSIWTPASRSTTSPEAALPAVVFRVVQGA
jgi:hypothetical protein